MKLRLFLWFIIITLAIYSLIATRNRNVYRYESGIWQERFQGLFEQVNERRR